MEKNTKLKNKIRSDSNKSKERPQRDAKTKSNKPKSKPKTKKAYNQIKPVKKHFNYFPRDNKDQSDFTYNIATIEERDKKFDFLNKKRSKSMEMKRVDDEGAEIKIDYDQEEKQVSRLNFPKFSVGDLVLLSISEVHKDYMIANYTRNIKAMIHSKYTGIDTNNPKFSLKKLFSIGQFIAGVVVSPGNDIQLDNGKMNRKILVSIDPKIVNVGITAKDLKIGMDIWGKLIYDEKAKKFSADFQLELKENCEEFFSKNINLDGEEEDEEEENEEEPAEEEEKSLENEDEGEENIDDELIENNHKSKSGKSSISNNISINFEEGFELENYKINGYYFFKIINLEKEENKLILTVSLDQEKHITPIATCDFKSLRPGFLFKSSTTRELKNGVEISFGGNLGGIFIDHLRKANTFLSRVIHISKTNQISLSAAKNIVNLKTKDIESKVQLVGTVHENVKIEEVVFGKSYQVRINEKKAFLHKINLDHKEPLASEEVVSRIKVKEYNFFDDKPILTAKIRDLDKAVLNWENLYPGQILEGYIKEITKEDIILQINEFISGKLNRIHISDFPLKAIPKKKYELNMRLKVKVLTFNYETKNLTFTSKESLMDSNLNPNIESLKEGDELLVTYIGNNLFLHCGEVKGKIINKLKESELIVGKLFNLKIYKIDVKKEKIVFTNSALIWSPGVGDFESHLKKNPILSLIVKLLNQKLKESINKKSDLTGEIREFNVIKPKNVLKLLIKNGCDPLNLNENVDCLTKRFLILRIQSDDEFNNLYAFCPTELVSDFHSDKIFSVLAKNALKHEMIVLHYNPENLFLIASPKTSLIDFGKEQKILRNKEEVEVDRIYAGYVNKVVEKKGIIIQFYNNIKYFVRSPKNHEIHYLPGQTLLAKYSSKLKFSLDIYKTYSSSEILDESNLYYRNYTKDLELLKKSKGLSFNLNQLIEGKVSLIKDYGVLVSISLQGRNYSGLLRKEHMKFYEKIVNNETKIEDNYPTGTTLQFKIIDIDYANEIIYLTDSDLKVKEENYKAFFDKNKNEQFDIVIELINENYITVSVKNKNIKGDLQCNLMNFNFESSQIYDLLKIGDSLKSKLIDFQQESNKLVFEFPLKIMKKIFTKEQNKPSNQIILGGSISGVVNGIKGDSIFLYINKNTIAKMKIENYLGDIEQLKESLSIKNEESVNSSNKIVIVGKIIHIEEKNNKTVLELTNCQEEGNSVVLKESSIILGGEKENYGIISKLDNHNKYPIHIDTSENKRIKIHFSKIPHDSLKILKDKFKVGEKITFYANIGKNDENEYSLIPFSKLSSDVVKIGSKIAVRILKKITGMGLVVELENNESGFIDICEISDDILSNPMESINVNYITLGRIIDISNGQKKQINVSLRSSILVDELYNIVINGSTNQFISKFKDKENLGDMRNKIMKYKAVNVIEQNMICLGYIVNSTEKGVFIKISKDVTVRAGLREISDEKAIKPYLLFSPENLVICKILSFMKNDEKIEKISVSLRESVIKYNLSLKLKDLSVNSFYECIVMNENEGKFQVNIIGSTFTGSIKTKDIHPNSIKLFKQKGIVVLQAIKIDKNIHPPKIRFSNLVIEDNDSFDKELIINYINDPNVLKNRVKFATLYDNVKEINQRYIEKKNVNELSVIEKNINEINFEEMIDSKVNYNESENDEEEENEENEEEQAEEEEEQNEIIESFKEKISKKAINEKVENKDIEMNIENEEVEEEKEKKKLNSSKKREKSKLKEELEIREKEKLLQKSNKETNENPQSVEDFEKLILSDFNKSIYWIQYTSYILDKLGINSAKKILERAINSIDISLSNEKLNVWIAYMNLENTYGTKESFKSVVERALEVNDKKTIYKHLINIYKQSGKYDMAFEVYKISIKSFFNDSNLWKNYIEFLFEANKNTIKKKFPEVEFFNPKDILNRSLQALPQKNHIEMLLKYGQIQYKNEQIEEARNTFESVLRNYPKRNDIWFVFIDQEIKYGDIERVRSLFEKCLTVEFKDKVLKNILKKYLEYEHKFGDEKGFQHVQKLTQEIISKRLKDSNNEGEDQNEENMNID